MWSKWHVRYEVLVLKSTVCFESAIREISQGTKEHGKSLRGREREKGGCKRTVCERKLKSPQIRGTRNVMGGFKRDFQTKQVQTTRYNRNKLWKWDIYEILEINGSRGAHGDTHCCDVYFVRNVDNQSIPSDKLLHAALYSVGRVWPNVTFTFPLWYKSVCQFNWMLPLEILIIWWSWKRSILKNVLSPSKDPFFTSYTWLWVP